MNKFFKDHAIGSVMSAMMLLCLAVFGYTFQETVSLRARVCSVEQNCASNRARQDALKESLNQHTKQMRERMDQMSKTLDTRLTDIRGMIQTLINVLAVEETTASAAQHAGG